jgi:hypothetical protein
LSTYGSLAYGNPILVHDWAQVYTYEIQAAIEFRMTHAVDDNKFAFGKLLGLEDSQIPFT